MKLVPGCLPLGMLFKSLYTLVAHQENQDKHSPYLTWTLLELN